MTLLQSLSLLLFFALVASYINHQWLKLPSAIGITLVAATLSLIFVIGNKQFGFYTDQITPMIKEFDFHGFLLHGILAFLLFAGAIKVNVSAIKRWAGPISCLATFGVVISAFVCGFVLWLAVILLNTIGIVSVHLPIEWAFLFGALIAPTDPIAALGIVKDINAPKKLELKLVGESLFNDGTGVVLFLAILGFIQGYDQTFVSVSAMFIREIIGGIALGFIMGALYYIPLKTTKDYPVLLLLTLSAATSSYALAEALHVSAPLCTVVAGLFIGHKMKTAIPEDSQHHVDTFWEFIDEMLNACLFALMGLELLVINLDWTFLLLGVIGFLCTIIGRFIGVALPLFPFKKRILKGTIPIISWGGMRGGISLALALSIAIPGQNELAQTLIAITFVTVILSSLGQGLTLKYLVQYYQKHYKNFESDNAIDVEKEKKEAGEADNF